MEIENKFNKNAIIIGFNAMIFAYLSNYNEAINKFIIKKVNGATQNSQLPRGKVFFRYHPWSKYPYILSLLSGCWQWRKIPKTSLHLQGVTH